MWWPFADEQAFWAWADDPDAEIDDPDSDLALQYPAGLPLLLAAAERPDCPKRDFCTFVLTDYACRIVGWDRTDVYPALRDTAAHAANSRDPRIRQWAAYVARLFSYREQRRPVNRAKAEQMAVDLLPWQTVDDRLGAAGFSDRIVVRIAPGGKHWQCAGSGPSPTYLYINRKSGGFRLKKFNPLPPAELAALT